jgi:hypothetical protein
MARNYDGVDLLWSNVGDFAIDHDGDIADTRFDILLAVAQDVYDRAKSNLRDWKESELIGASISDFSGEPNTLNNGLLLKRRIISSMIPYGIIDPTDISVDVYPIAIDKIVGEISLRVAPTARNRNTPIINQRILYDYSENNTVPRG